MIPETVYDAEVIGYEGDADAALVARVGSATYRFPLAYPPRDGERESVGVVGVVRRVLPSQDLGAIGRPVYRFERYIDQTLRRAPSLDGPDGERVRAGQNPNTTGWLCAAQPKGFRAPAGLLPGQDGAFEPDNSVAVTVRVPREFVQDAARYGMRPDELLQAFAVDLAGIVNWTIRPRADGFASNGSDEREMAAAWLERAYAYRREDAERAEAAAVAAEEADAERADFGWLLDDWIAAGGDAQELRAAVEQMIAAKDAENEGKTDE